MRLSGLGSLTMGMILLNRADASAEDCATHCVVKALRTACGPWMMGGDRDVLSAKMERDGWDAIDDALFSKTGGWGTVSISLLHDSKPQRSCEVRMSSNDQPWSTVAAATAANAWIAGAFPNAEFQRSLSTLITGQPARMTVWGCLGRTITLIEFEVKQASPNSDFILLIE